jgi:tetratricopeptide (TPR) repeat protein
VKVDEFVRCPTCDSAATTDVIAHFSGACPYCLTMLRPGETLPAVRLPIDIERRIVPPSVKARGVPAELDSIILKCLSHNPADRYSNVAEMVKDLQNWKKGEAVDAHSRGIGYRAWKFVAKRKAKVAALAAAVAVAIGLWRIEVNRLDSVATREAALWTRVGEERLDRGDDAGAHDAFTRAIEIRPTAKAYLDRNYASWRLLDYRACAIDTARALALEPGNPAAIRSRAAVASIVR